MSLSLVLILAIKHFHLGILDKGVVNIFAALDIQLQVHVALPPGALVVNIDTLHKVECVALKKVADSALNFGVLQKQKARFCGCWTLPVTLLLSIIHIICQLHCVALTASGQA